MDTEFRAKVHCCCARRIIPTFAPSSNLANITSDAPSHHSSYGWVPRIHTNIDVWLDSHQYGDTARRSLKCRSRHPPPRAAPHPASSSVIEEFTNPLYYLCLLHLVQCALCKHGVHACTRAPAKCWSIVIRSETDKTPAVPHHYGVVPGSRLMRAHPWQQIKKQPTYGHTIWH